MASYYDALLGFAGADPPKCDGLTSFRTIRHKTHPESVVRILFMNGCLLSGKDLHRTCDRGLRCGRFLAPWCTKSGMGLKWPLTTRMCGEPHVSLSTGNDKLRLAGPGAAPEGGVTGYAP